MIDAYQTGTYIEIDTISKASDLVGYCDSATSNGGGKSIPGKGIRMLSCHPGPRSPRGPA